MPINKRNTKNLYVSSTFLKNGKSIKYAIKLLNSCNIFNIEIGSNHCYEKNLNFFKKFSVKNNFLLHNYFPVPKKSFVINIASDDVRIRNKSIEQIKKSINLAKKYNFKIFSFHPGFIGDPDESIDPKNRNFDFIWKKKIKTSYQKAWNNLINSLKIIVKEASKKKIKICLETEGSIDKKKFLLLQRPIEFDKLYKIFNKKQISINLNVGHLNLSSKVNKFDKIKFINKISNKIAAFELSHNYGKKDDHAPLKKDGWYWKVLNNKKFRNTIKILEYRETDIKLVKKNYNMCANKLIN